MDIWLKSTFFVDRTFYQKRIKSKKEKKNWLWQNAIKYSQSDVSCSSRDCVMLIRPIEILPEASFLNCWLRSQCFSQPDWTWKKNVKNIFPSFMITYKAELRWQLDGCCFLYNCPFQRVLLRSLLEMFSAYGYNVKERASQPISRDVYGDEDRGEK